VLSDQGGKGVRDLFAMGLVPEDVAGKSRFRSVAFSPNQIYLLVLLGIDKTTYLASIDMTNGAFADVKRVANRLLVFTKPSTNFLTTPDGRVMIYAWNAPDATSATFSEVVVAADGTLSFHPHLTLSAKEAHEVSAGVPIGFLPDPRGDGSYDLMLGCQRGRPDTRVRLIGDFIAPRHGTRRGG
jgi:hypothetical protein